MTIKVNISLHNSAGVLASSFVEIENDDFTMTDLIDQAEAMAIDQPGDWLLSDGDKITIEIVS